MVKESDFLIENIVKMKPDISKVHSSDIMTSSPVTVRSFETLGDAVKIMNEKHFTSLPVVNEKNHLIGLLSKSDILKYTYEKLDSLDKFLHSFQGKDLKMKLEDILPEMNKYKGIGDVKVKDIMNKFVFSVSVNSPAIEAIREMNKNKIHRLFVVNQEGEITGIISSLDVLRFLGDQ